ncbi:MAG: hypothetical protein HW405_243 [Candidatus Berkelbacteria bacterium]|nr:hypothetical protein [Candidatus Berkelbacteria bacterium]
MTKKQSFLEIETLIKVAKVLDELKIPYYVSGGYAVSIYGRPRFTADLDMIIKMSLSQGSDFTKRMVVLFPTGYVDKDQIDNALKNSGEFNIIDPESGLKIDFFIAQKGDFEEECFKKAKRKDVGYKVKFTSPENLIISKLIWYKDSSSTRHLEDIESVLSNSHIDQRSLNSWIRKIGLEEEWEKARK